MKFLPLFLIFVSLFDCYIFYNEFLTKESISISRILLFPPNSDQTVILNLIEVINPFKEFRYRDKYDKLHNTKHLIEMVVNGNITYQLTVIAGDYFQDVWVRVVPFRKVIPGGCFWIPRVEVTNNTWSTSLTINSAIYNNETSLRCNQQITHAVYALPIYPKSNLKSWSSDYKTTYKNKEQILFDAINNSISVSYLEQNADLLVKGLSSSNVTTYTLANRRNRDYLIIIVAYGGKHESAEYPPVYISGCLSSDYTKSTCELSTKSYPMYIVLGLAIVFLIFGQTRELFHVILFGWISTGFITFVIWCILSKSHNLSETTHFIIWLGIAPSLGFTFLILFKFLTKKYNKARMILTALLISMLILSCLWSTPLREYAKNNIVLFASVSGVVLLVVTIALCVCNFSTLVIGGIFLGAVLISVSVSINNMNSSIIPFFLIDFLNMITFSVPNWLYYSPMLKEDLIILILCPLLSIFLGFFIYRTFMKIVSKEKGEVNLENQRRDSYGTIEMNHAETPQLQNLPRPVVQPVVIFNVAANFEAAPTTSNTNTNNATNDLPPSYASVVRETDAPFAPSAPSAPALNAYDGPYKGAF